VSSLFATLEAGEEELALDATIGLVGVRRTEHFDPHEAREAAFIRSAGHQYALGCRILIILVSTALDAVEELDLVLVGVVISSIRSSSVCHYLSNAGCTGVDGCLAALSRVCVGALHTGEAGVIFVAGLGEAVKVLLVLELLFNGFPLNNGFNLISAPLTAILELGELGGSRPTAAVTCVQRSRQEEEGECHQVIIHY